MILDGHIHMNSLKADKADFLDRLKTAGIDGGIVISYRPNSFNKNIDKHTSAERLSTVISLVEGCENLYPFYWIDPLEEDALEQVQLAVEKGIAGFKVICNRFYPGEPRPLEVFTEIARQGKPILFHSGILWDGQPSSKYHRPAEFEALINIEGLRFTLAHISWPWVDECIAVYGKYQDAKRNSPEIAEMFIDTTPGTPPIYREEALRKLFTVGYDVENNVIFGSDNLVESYNVHWGDFWIKKDKEIYGALGVEAGVLNKIYSANLKRFIGK